MKRGHIGNQIDLFRIQIIPVGPLCQLLQQRLGDNPYMQDVKAALTVTEFHDMAEDFYHDQVAFFFFQNLLRHQVFQSLLLGIKSNGIFNTALYRLLIKRTADIFRRSELIGMINICGRSFCRNHDDRKTFQQSCTVHGSKHLKSVHFRHDDIQQHHGQFGMVLVNQHHCLKAVGSLQQTVIRGKHIRQ